MVDRRGTEARRARTSDSDSVHSVFTTATDLATSERRTLPMLGKDVDKNIQKSVRIILYEIIRIRFKGH